MRTAYRSQRSQQHRHSRIAGKGLLAFYRRLPRCRLENQTAQTIIKRIRRSRAAKTLRDHIFRSLARLPCRLAAAVSARLSGYRVLTVSIHWSIPRLQIIAITGQLYGPPSPHPHSAIWRTSHRPRPNCRKRLSSRSFPAIACSRFRTIPRGRIHLSGSGAGCGDRSDSAESEHGVESVETRRPQHRRTAVSLVAQALSLAAQASSSDVVPWGGTDLRGKPGGASECHPAGLVSLRQTSVNGSLHFQRDLDRSLRIMGCRQPNVVRRCKSAPHPTLQDVNNGIPIAIAKTSQKSSMLSISLETRPPGNRFRLFNRFVTRSGITRTRVHHAVHHWP